MADLKRNNNCSGCKFYDMEANDYYYQWCTHPNIEDEDKEGNSIYQSEDDNSHSDFTSFVTKCPIDKHDPYQD